MPSYKAGQEIDAFCTKCKMDLLHKIVAVASGKPVKVECRTCKTVHQYRPVKGVKSPGAAPVAPPPKAASAPRAAAGKKAPAVEPPSAPPQGVHVFAYKITERFAPETWIQHKVFGMGQVVREVPPDKIEVRFDRETKVLVHGKG